MDSNQTLNNRTELQNILGRAAMAFSSNEDGQARQLFEKAMDLIDRCDLADYPESLVCMRNLATIYYADGDLERALDVYSRLVMSSEKQMGEGNREVIGNIFMLAKICDELEQYDDATSLYARVLKLSDKFIPKDDLLYRHIKDAYGQRNTGQKTLRQTVSNTKDVGAFKQVTSALTSKPGAGPGKIELLKRNQKALSALFSIVALAVAFVWFQWFAVEWNITPKGIMTADTQPGTDLHSQVPAAGGDAGDAGDAGGQAYVSGMIDGTPGGAGAAPGGASTVSGGAVSGGAGAAPGATQSSERISGATAGTAKPGSGKSTGKSESTAKSKSTAGASVRGGLATTKVATAGGETSNTTGSTISPQGTQSPPAGSNPGFRSADGELSLVFLDQSRGFLKYGNESLEFDYKAVSSDFEGMKTLVAGLFTRKTCWLEATAEGIAADDGTILFNQDAPEVKVFEQLRKLQNYMQRLYAQNLSYPSKQASWKNDHHVSQINAFTGVPEKPSLQIFSKYQITFGEASNDSEFPECLSKGQRWVDEPPGKPGVINCFAVYSGEKVGDDFPTHQFYAHGYGRDGRIIGSATGGKHFIGLYKGKPIDPNRIQSASGVPELIGTMRGATVYLTTQGDSFANMISLRDFAPTMLGLFALISFVLWLLVDMKRRLEDVRRPPTFIEIILVATVAMWIIWCVVRAIA